MSVSSVPGVRAPRGVAELAATLAPLYKELESFLTAQPAAFPPEVQPLVVDTLRHSGKKLRPLLVFMAGGGQEAAATTRPDLVRAAAIVELVHLATLVHDDILDQADLRHHATTLNARYGADTAVLLGDALFAHALKLAADFPTVEVCRWVAEATRIVCAGEIEQTFARGRADFGEADYWRMVDGKTGELFAVSARLGAFLAGREVRTVTAVANFARDLGAAYQLYDDAVDLLSTTEEAGKSLGTDLAGGKMTLPILLLRDAIGADAWAALAMQLGSGALRLEALTSPMHDADVWPTVVQVFTQKLADAEAHLAPWREESWTTGLRDLAHALQARAEKLLNAGIPAPVSTS